MGNGEEPASKGITKIDRKGAPATANKGVET